MFLIFPNTWLFYNKRFKALIIKQKKKETLSSLFRGYMGYPTAAKA